MAASPITFISPEQYLEMEREAEYKSEYYEGEVVAMSGASRAHNLLAGNLIGELRQQMRGRSCEAYPGDMRVSIGRQRYFYPDVSAVCGEPKFADHSPDTLQNPAFVAGILSPATERLDRGYKAEGYRRIESLRQYLLASQDHVHVELYTRGEDGKWILTEASSKEDTVELDSIGCRLKVADLYEKVRIGEGNTAA